MADCSSCKKTFSKTANLKRHVKKEHPEKIIPSASTVEKEKDHICKECNGTFSTLSNLRKHIKQKHPGQLEKLASYNKKVYKCQMCELTFDTLMQSKMHKKVHKPMKLKCSLCQNFHSTKENILKHYSEVHSLKIDFENLEFSSLNDFKDWKAKVEKETFASFVKLRGEKKNTTRKRVVYACHRSGSFKTKGVNIRSLKTQGSNKINAYCPALINVLIQGEICTVSFCKTHVGHKQKEDMGHLFLTDSARQMLAAKVAAQIPLQTILNNVRDSVSNCQLERVHLLTKRDLYNIESSFNLNKTSVRHQNDAVSVDLWVKELQNMNSVLLYKPQDSLSTNHPELKQQDFFLAIMTAGQKELLLSFGQDCICIDGTHGLNGYGFEMHTIMVLDDLREGYPCAFLISNRSDAEAMKIFFTCIHENIGKKIAPKVFMSDMAEAYYNAWLQVMDPAKFKLYCTWHVDRAWRKNLDKIPDKEKKVVIYQMMRMLLQERDMSTFNILLQKFKLHCQEDPDTADFIKYFEFYITKQQQWAYCFRIHSGLNTNMHIERMHRTIKHLYLNGKFTKRLDKAICAIMKFTRDKIFERIIVAHKGKVCTKLADMRQRHRISESLDAGQLVQGDSGWIVPSSSNKELYIIEELSLECPCKLICSKCSLCIHRFTCTCLDSSIKWNMCKHIHLVGRYLLDQHTTNSRTEEIHSDKLVIETVEEGLSVSALVESVSCNRDPSQLLKEEQEKLILLVQQSIRGTRSLDEINIVKKIVAPIDPTLEAVRNTSSNYSFELPTTSRNIPSNKNIEPQRRLYPTKKKRTPKHKVMSAPSNEEADKLAMQLLMPPSDQLLKD